MSIQSAVADALKVLPKGLAVGVVDMSMGALIHVETKGQYPMALFEELASMVGILLQGQHVRHAEDRVDALRGTKRNDGEHYFNEMLLRTDHTLHIFLRGEKYTEHGIVFVSKKDANIGMSYFRATEARTAIEAAL